MSSMVLHGDCVDIMAWLPDDSVDLVFTSPPYANRRNSTYGGIWPSKYVEWFLPRAAQIKRVLKPTGSFVLNVKEHGQDGEKSLWVYRLVIALHDELEWRYIDDYCWHKSNAMPGHWNTRLADAWEHLYHFAHHRNGFTFNRRDLRVPRKESTARRVPRKLGPNDNERQYSSTGSGLARNISNMCNNELVFPNNVMHGPVSNDKVHSAAMPLWLANRFIRLMSNEGDVVLDPFAGSGTTLVAANELGRSAIGIDIHADNCELMRRRTAQNIMLFNTEEANGRMG